MKKQLLIITTCATIASMSVASESPTGDTIFDKAGTFFNDTIKEVKQHIPTLEEVKQGLAKSAERLADENRKELGLSNNEEQSAKEEKNALQEPNTSKPQKKEPIKTSNISNHEKKKPLVKPTVQPTNTPSPTKQPQKENSSEVVSKKYSENNSDNDDNESQNTTLSLLNSHKWKICGTIIATPFLLAWSSVAKGYHYLQSKKRWSATCDEEEISKRFTKTKSNINIVQELREEIEAINHYVRQYNWLRSYHVIPKIKCFEQAPERIKTLRTIKYLLVDY